MRMHIEWFLDKMMNQIMEERTGRIVEAARPSSKTIFVSELVSPRDLCNNASQELRKLFQDSLATVPQTTERNKSGEKKPTVKL